ncbi:MAG: hypothetical protein JRK53_03070 [Deltaproteobacteria bacterium]|nr:hypothetical protein [Deltaproteobacteria bacterium]MBW1818702.1 hypothetical protein [Deltaproteobacteria bacterium]
MKGHGAKLPRKKQEAVAALIEAPTIKEAAEVVGIGQATLFRWLQEDDFKISYRQAKRRIVDQAIARLRKATSEAVSTLSDIMTDDGKPASSRVSAAKIILESAVKSVELDDLGYRIENLEREIEERRH